MEVAVEEKCTKMLYRFQWIFRTRHSTLSLSMTSLSLAGVYCARTLLGRRVCKRADVYMITLSCTWRIYALSERLLVLDCVSHVSHCQKRAVMIAEL